MKTIEETRKSFRLRLRKKRIQIPAWVPKRLIVEFADCALAHGEERAARYVAKLKRELESDAGNLDRVVSKGAA